MGDYGHAPLTSELTIAPIDAAAHRPPPENSYRYVLRTPGEDRNKNITDPEGWALDSWLANPIISEAHSWVHQLPVGKGVAAWMEGPLLYVDLEFASTERGQLLRQLTDDGVLRAVSASWVPLTYDLRYKENSQWPIGVHSHTQELVEVGIVAVPADAGSLRIAAALADHLDVTREAGPPEAQELLTALRNASAALRS